MSYRSAQPAGKRAQVRGGGGDASDGAYVYMHVFIDLLELRLDNFD
jgi:hypothetical protein